MVCRAVGGDEWDLVWFENERTKVTDLGPVEVTSWCTDRLGCNTGSPFEVPLGGITGRGSSANTLITTYASGSDRVGFVLVTYQELESAGTRCILSELVWSRGG